MKQYETVKKIKPLKIKLYTYIIFMLVKSSP